MQRINTVLRNVLAVLSDTGRSQDLVGRKAGTYAGYVLRLHDDYLLPTQGWTIHAAATHRQRYTHYCTRSAEEQGQAVKQHCGIGKMGKDPGANPTAMSG